MCKYIGLGDMIRFETGFSKQNINGENLKRIYIFKNQIILVVKHT